MLGSINPQWVGIATTFVVASAGLYLAFRTYQMQVEDRQTRDEERLAAAEAAKDANLQFEIRVIESTPMLFVRNAGPHEATDVEVGGAADHNVARFDALFSTPRMAAGEEDGVWIRDGFYLISGNSQLGLEVGWTDGRGPHKTNVTAHRRTVGDYL